MVELQEDGEMNSGDQKPKARRKVRIKFTEPTLTKQSFAKDCDINQILKKWMKTGNDPRDAAKQPLFGDFYDQMDYEQSIGVVRMADEAFADLPAEVRARFGNDPNELLEYMHVPGNEDEKIALGLIEAPVVVAPTAETETTPTAEGGEPPIAGGNDAT